MQFLNEWEIQEPYREQRQRLNRLIRLYNNWQRLAQDLLIDVNITLEELVLDGLPCNYVSDLEYIRNRLNESN